LNKLHKVVEKWVFHGFGGSDDIATDRDRVPEKVGMCAEILLLASVCRSGEYSGALGLNSDGSSRILRENKERKCSADLSRMHLFFFSSLDVSQVHRVTRNLVRHGRP